MYAQLGAQPGYQKLLKTCPILATWDDHDYGGDDAGADYPKKKESQQALLDFFGVPKDSPRRKQEGIYHAAVFGPPGKRVQVILLDMRYFRSPLKKDLKRPRNLGQYVPVTDPNATLLGTFQWKWLEQQLKVPAEVRLIGSSVQVVAEDHGFEKWMNIPHERERLYQLIRDTRAAGVIFLSGDRHLAELSVMDGGVGYPLYDLTSSGLNMANKRFRKLEPNRHRVAIMDVGNNFGLVKIDWTRADPLINLEIHDDEGDVMIRHKVALSRLQPKRTRPVKKGEIDLAAEARKHLDKEWTVELTVRATGRSRTSSLVFLNSEKDFKSEQNLTIVLDLKALDRELKAARITDPAKHFAGKKIRVRGTVSEFRGNPQIEVKKLDQILLVE
jgi:alkaline phosphatase D